MQPGTIADLLKPDERVMWRGTPTFAPFVLRSLGIVLFGLTWLIIPLSMLQLIRSAPSASDIFWKIGSQFSEEGDLKVILLHAEILGKL